MIMIMIMRTLTRRTPMIMMIGMLALVEVSTPPLTTAVEAQKAAATPTTTTIIGNTTDTSSGIELSPQPVFQERARILSETPINQAHMSITFSGNGTLTLPNNIDTIINFTSNGSALISFVTQSAHGTETIITEDGETATATFYEIVDFNPATLESKGIVIAVVHTNPIGTLAPLNGMVLTGIDDIQPNDDESHVTLWKWESGISNFDIVPVQSRVSNENNT
jgi:hypothetical protein